MNAETPLRLLARRVDAHPQSICIRARHDTGETVLRYADVAMHAAALSARFSRLGVRPGASIVMFAEEDVVPFLLCEIAAMLAGAVVVPLSPRFSADRLAQVASRIGAVAVICSRQQLAKPLSKGLAAWLLPGDGEAPAGSRSLDVAPAHIETTSKLLRDRAAASSPRDVVLLMPTSGTTGEPKLVIKNAFALLRASRHLADRLSDAEQPRFLVASALTHLVGQGIVMHALRTGGQLCIPSRLDADCPLSDVLDLDPTVIITTPRVLRSLHRQHTSSAGSSDRFVPPGTRFVMTMGAAVPPDLVRALLRNGIDVADSYGSTETGLIAVTPRGGWKEGVVGLPNADVAVQLADDGELVVSMPPECGVGYYAGTAPAPALDASGAYHTGDFGSIDEDGNIRIRGRKSDVFNTPDGSNIFPMHTEMLIEALPWVAQIALIGDGRPFIAALIVLAAPPGGAEGYLDPLRHHELYDAARRDLARINARLETIEQVRRVALFASRMPADLYQIVAAGKVKRDRRGLVARYQAQVDALYANAVGGTERLDEVAERHVA